MGAWGEGPFENDDAADWVDEVGEALPAERAALIRAALQDVLDAAGDNRDGFVEAPEANRAVAAAVVVAATLPGRAAYPLRAPSMVPHAPGAARNAARCAKPPPRSSTGVRIVPNVR